MCPSIDWHILKYITLLSPLKTSIILLNQLMVPLNVRVVFFFKQQIQLVVKVTPVYVWPTRAKPHNVGVGINQDLRINISLRPPKIMWSPQAQLLYDTRLILFLDWMQLDLIKRRP